MSGADSNTRSDSYMRCITQEPLTQPSPAAQFPNIGVPVLIRTASDPSLPRQSPRTSFSEQQPSRTSNLSCNVSPAFITKRLLLLPLVLLCVSCSSVGLTTAVSRRLGRPGLDGSSTNVTVAAVVAGRAFLYMCLSCGMQANGRDILGANCTVSLASSMPTLNDGLERDNISDQPPTSGEG